MFTEDNKAKCVAPKGGMCGKFETDPYLTASCHMNNNNNNKELEWPQVIESLSPMTSGRTEVVHNVYHVAIEQPQVNNHQVKLVFLYYRPLVH